MGSRLRGNGAAVAVATLEQIQLPGFASNLEMLEAFDWKIEFRSIGGHEPWRAAPGGRHSDARDRHAGGKAGGFERTRPLRRNGCEDFVVVAAGQDRLQDAGAFAARTRAAPESGIAATEISAETCDASHMRDRSSAKPSDMSIAAEASLASAGARASRGSG